MIIEIHLKGGTVFEMTGKTMEQFRRIRECFTNEHKDGAALNYSHFDEMLICWNEVALIGLKDKRD